MAKKSQPNKRYQIQHKFWLNMFNPIERELSEWCKVLVGKRQFTSVVRDGLMLMRELREGKTDFLFARFPQIRAKLYAQMEADVIESLAIQRESEAVRRLEQIERMLSNINSEIATKANSPKPVGLQPLGGIKPLNAPKLDVPHYDDDGMDLVVAKAKGSDGSANRNFINSMMALQKR